MTEHRLKSWPKFFDAVACGDKAFEVRYNDRNYKLGDILILEKFDPETGRYIACDPLRRRVTFVLEGWFNGIYPSHVVLSLGLE